MQFKNSLWSAIAWLAITALPVNSQDRQAHPRPNLLQSVEAVLDWYAKEEPYTLAAGASIVISPKTSTMRPVDKHGRELAEVRQISIPQGWIRAISEQIGRNVRTCGEFDEAGGTEGLCSIPLPWVWLHVSTPVVNATGEVLVSVDEFTLAEGPEEQVALQPLFRLFTIERSASGWVAREEAHH